MKSELEQKIERKVRRLMVQGLSRKEANEQVATLMIQDFEDAARNAEIVNLYHSKQLGMVSVPE